MSAYSQRYRVVFFFLVPLIFHQVYSQEKIDTSITEVNILNEVIVTDQYKRGSVSGKLFTVNEISRQDIEKLAGNTLADILHYQLNIDIIPDAQSGRSTVRMFGLGGEYVKILVDNMPMVSDNGYGNNIDINQINLDEVERIEVVEGAMGVLYGDNAVAGLINIVTKKGIEGKWEVQAGLQEETVGGEYDWSEKGRHIQSLKMSYNISDRLYVSASFNRNDFQGFFNNFRGKDYFKIEGSEVKNDELRGHEWNPKEQLNLTGGLYYTAPRFNVYYKFGYYDETLDIYSHVVNSRAENGAYSITANDQQYNTSRFVHQLYADGKWKTMNYTLSLSFQKQERDFMGYVYNVGERRKQEVTKDITDQSSDLLFSRGVLSQIFPKSELFDLTVGYELVNQKGYDVSASGAHSAEIVEKRLENYDAFATVDLNFTDRFSLYPGLRINNNSSYGTHWIWGLTAGYELTDDIKLKGVFGSAYKTPSFEQLFYYFVDANHDVQGNPDLRPEDGLSALVSVEKRSDLNNVSLKHSIKAFHFNIKDKISLILVGNDSPGGSFRYMNIDSHRVLGASFENSLRYKNLSAGLGLSYIGIAQELGSEENSRDDYLYNFTGNAVLSYTIPSKKIILTTQLKYNGAQPQYVEKNNDAGETVYVKGKQDAFTWWDASAKKYFLNNSLELTAGVRNLLDVVSVNTTAVAGGAHGGPPNSALLGYGRSFYLKLLYKFKN
ncbi:TonB-dependent receptor plug domain-containing protein [Sinomicrobium sp.]